MQRSHVLLAAGAVALIGVAGWLFHEVNATPAEASVTAHPGEVVGGTVTEPAGSALDGSAAKAGARHSDWSAVASGLEHKQAATRPPDDTEIHERVGPPVGAPAPTGRVNLGPETDDKKANPRKDAILAEVNRAYDHGDYDEAKAAAEKVLKEDPTNARMLRVAVSSSCILGDATDAQAYYAKLSDKRDREQMKARCDRYGVTFTDPK